MNEKEARILADLVASETNHEIQVEPSPEGEEQWVVTVRVTRPGGDAISQTFTLRDEDMWEWLGERIRNA